MGITRPRPDGGVNSPSALYIGLPDYTLSYFVQFQASLEISGLQKTRNLAAEKMIISLFVAILLAYFLF